MIDTSNINLDYIYSITNSDSKFQTLLLNTAHQEVLGELQSVTTFFQNKQWKECGGIVHKFKGKVDLFNLRDQIEFFRNMERKLRTGSPTDEEAKHLVQSFIKILEEILVVFEKHL